MFYYVNMNCKKGLTNCFLLLAISTDFSFVFVLTDLILTDSIDILFYALPLGYSIIYKRGAALPDARLLGPNNIKKTDSNLE